MTDAAQLEGTVYDLLGSLSQVTEPLLDTLINLYWNVVPTGREVVIDHKGLLLVYPEAERGSAAPVFHEPSCGMDPAILMVSPTTVVTSSLKVTATFAGMVQTGGVLELDAEDEVEEVDEGEETVVEGGKEAVEDEPPPVPPVMAISAQER